MSDTSGLYGRPYLDIHMPGPGQLWKHYKGNIYMVHAIGYDDAGFPVVIHYSSDEQGAFHTRRLHEWLQWIDVQADTVVGGVALKTDRMGYVKVPRYEFHDEAL